MEQKLLRTSFERLVQKTDSNASLYESSIDEDKPVIIANWHKIEKRFPNLCGWYENNDCNTGFDDEWDYCQDCYRAIFTTPQYYGDLGNWISTEYGLICQDCWLENPDTDDYINCGVDFPKAILPWMLETFQKMGFQCLEDADACKRFESGFHLGQNDTPAGAIEQLEEIFPGLYHEMPGDQLEYIFLINSAGQFDINWSIWFRINKKED
jgi:hypothetical protein